jgi:hypothetical protein
MEHRALAALILRFTGLVVLVITITSVATNFVAYFYPSPMRNEVGIGFIALSIVVSALLPLLIALVLIYFPSTVLTKVLRVPGLEGPIDSDILPLQRVAFAAIGLWIMLDGITDAVFVASQTRWYFSLEETLRSLPSPGYQPALSPHEFAAYVVAALQVILGFALLLGNRALANLLARLRG